VYQDQRAAVPLRHEVGADHGLADAGRRHEHANVVLKQRIHGFLLHGRQPPLESEAKGVAGHPLVLDLERDAVYPQQHLELGLASSRQAHELRQILGARDHSRRRRRREVHVLLLVELRVLEGREPLDLVDQRRR